jgi:leader peptidase (prepilin peptidase)/N-methyltransferase
MNAALAAFSVAPALAIGSFLNVVAARLPERRSLVRPASACPSCGVAIAWRDNIPVLSYLLLRRRCRSCGVGISARYLAVELSTAVLVAGCFLRFGFTGQALVGAFFVSVLVVLSAIDVERRILPNRIVLPATAVAFAAQLSFYPDQALEWTFGALGASLFLFLALLAYPAGMGMGDVKLALLLGVVLGKNVAAGMMIGMVAAMVLGIFLFVRHGKAARKMAIPFGPFLAFGAIVALFWGDLIMDAYLSR